MKRTWFAFLTSALAAAVLTCGLATSITLAQEKRCRPAKHARVSAIKELTYHKARKRLIAAGWQPLRTKMSADADSDIRYGNGPLFWKRGYVEVEVCAGTGLAQCAFLFKDAYGNRLRVITEGEELPEEKSYAIVARFRFICE